MAHILFSNYPYSNFSRCWPRQASLPANIRLSIFLIIGECAGLPVVVWALRFLYHRFNTGSRVSSFVITLLLCDLLVLLLNPFIVTKLLQDEKCWDKSTICRLLYSSWSALIICGLHLQQVVALEAALRLRYPFHFAHVFFPSCSTIISIFVFTYSFLCEVFRATLLVLFTLPLLLVITLTSWVITCKTPLRISDTPYRTEKPSFTVLGFVTLTLILYATFSSTCAIMYISRRLFLNLFVMGLSLMSLNVIIDPLLCVIIYKMSTELNQSEVNT